MTSTRLALPFLLSALVSMAPRVASGHSADEPHDHHRPRAPVRDPSAYRSPRYAAFELRLGPYRPDVDSEFSNAQPFQQVFGSGHSIMFGLEADYQALRIPHFASLGPGFGASFVSYNTYGQFADGAGRSEHATGLWVLPLYFAGVMRIDVFARDFQVPLVPYVKGAFVIAPWEARDAGGVSVDANGRQGKGIETGLAFHAGLMLELNFLAPQTAVEMDSATGVNSTYLFGEFMMSDVDSFGKGMQVGTETFMFGITVEY
jgi:hypothetical protein